MPELDLSDADLVFRAQSWKAIRAIVKDESIPEGEKLRQCLEVASVYAALTGDDSMFPLHVRQTHQEMSKWLKANMEKLEKRKQARERDAARGQDFLGGIE